MKFVAPLLYSSYVVILPRFNFQNVFITEVVDSYPVVGPTSKIFFPSKYRHTYSCCSINVFGSVSINENLRKMEEFYVRCMV